MGLSSRDQRSRRKGRRGARGVGGVAYSPSDLTPTQNLILSVVALLTLSSMNLAMATSTGRKYPWAT